MSIMQQMLQACALPSADITGKAVRTACGAKQWDAAWLLLKQLRRHDSAAAAQLLVTMTSMWPASAAATALERMIDGWLDSETEQQRAALEKERQGLQVQRLGLQQLLVGVACMQRQAAVVPAAAPSLQTLEASDPSWQYSQAIWQRWCCHWQWKWLVCTFRVARADGSSKQCLHCSKNKWLACT
jgi:hypothetical protein